jgi:hypothetical protein
MNRKLLVIALTLTFAAMLYAQGEKSVTINGYLIDNACAGSAKDVAARAKTHATSCALMDGCEKSGYSVVGDDKKVYKLDEKGNGNAADLLTNTKTQKGVKVAVEGTVEGDVIHVTKITEVAAAATN